MTAATSMRRYETPSGWYELTKAEPSARLRPYVLAYWGREEHSTRPVTRLEVPYPNVIVSISFGPAQHVGSASHTSFVAGLHEHAVRTEHDGRVFGIELALTPPAAHALFRTPMHLVSSRSVELEDLIGRDVTDITGRLPELSCWRARFDAFDDYLSRRFAGASPPSREAVWAFRQLTRTSGRYPVERLARELGWSRKRLWAQFRESVGLAPKTYARLVRFGRAETLLRAGERDWVDLALECGYCDQAHFNRDFRDFAGMTPTELVGRLSPDDPGLAAD